jgi:proline iminopeptidase
MRRVVSGIGFLCVAALPSRGQTPKRLPVEGGTLAYFESGTGQPVLLLTGGPGFSHDYLDPVFLHISTYARAITLDQRGTGASSFERVDRTTMTVQKSVDDLEALRSFLRLDSWTILGHSWGGMLAMAYATQHPDRVTALVLSSSGGLNLDFSQRFRSRVESHLTMAQRDSVKFWSDSAQRSGTEQPVRNSLAVLLNGYLHDKGKIPLVTPALSPGSFSVAVAQRFDLSSYDLRALIDRVTCPTLIIQGSDDPADTAEELRAAIRHSVVQIIPNVGHFAWVEDSAAFFAAIDPFLRGR